MVGARRSGRLVRAAAVVVGVVVVGAVVVLAVFFRRQTYSYVTHRKGGPTETRAWEAHDPPPDMRIAVVGDTGDSGRRLDEVAAAMDRVEGDDEYSALLLLGDNVYPDGDVSQLDAVVHEPFGPVLDGGTELLAILGNHDVLRGSGEEMMDLLGMDGRTWSRQVGDVLVVGLDTNDLDDAQVRWLDRTLAASDATWKLVAMHHPPYSAGYQGSSEEVRKAVAPVLERHGVQLALSGHDHDYQRSRTLDGVTYVVSGAGSGSRRTGEDDFTAVSYGQLHFVDLAVWDDRLVLRAVDDRGRVMDEVTLAP